MVNSSVMAWHAGVGMCRPPRECLGFRMMQNWVESFFQQAAPSQYA
jgi:hypothetical protein